MICSNNSLIIVDLNVPQSRLRNDEEKDARAGVAVGLSVGIVLVLLAAIYCCRKQLHQVHSKGDLEKPGAEEKETGSSISLGNEASLVPSDEDAGLGCTTTTQVL